MIYAQCYVLDTGYVPGTIPPDFTGARKPTEACGSDGVLVLDGRWSLGRKDACAALYGRRRGFVGYRLYQGRTFTEARPCGPYISLTEESTR